MHKGKISSIIDPIYDSLYSKHYMLYENPELNLIETSILEELKTFKNRFTVKEALYFSFLFQQLSDPYLSRKQNLWREFVFVHLTFLFGKKVFYSDVWLLSLICDAITRETIKEERYLLLLSDETWMTKILEHTLYIDFSSSLTNQYKIDQDRLKKVFTFLCRKIEIMVKTLPKNIELIEIKKDILKQIKQYQSNQLFKRSVS